MPSYSRDNPRQKKGPEDGIPLALTFVDPEPEDKGTASAVPDDITRLVWCDIRRSRIVARSRLACFRDLDGDGTLEIAYDGRMAVFSSPLTIHRLTRPRRIKPVPYRETTASERPAFRAGYNGCGTNGRDQIIRYTTVIKDTSNGRAAGSETSCTHAAKVLQRMSDGRPEIVEMDRIELTLSYDGNDVRYTVSRAIPPGTLLDRLIPDEPFLDLGQGRGLAESLAYQLVKLAEPYLAATAEPSVQTGEIEPGRVFLTVPIKHFVTGTLEADIKKGGWFALVGDKDVVKAGQPVYGVRLGATLSALFPLKSVTWCAPMKSDSGKWKAICFPDSLHAHRWVTDSITPFSVSSLYWHESSTPSASAPIVARGPVDFGVELQAGLRIKEWRKKALIYEFGVGPVGEEMAWQERSVAVERRGLALLYIVGGVFRLERVDDKGDLTRVTLDSPTKVGMDAFPQRFRRLGNAAPRDPATETSTH